MIPYLNPGEAITAAEWNVIFSTADAALAVALNGFSPLFCEYFSIVGSLNYPLGSNFDRCFFFFDPVNLPTGLHLFAETFLGLYGSTLGNGFFFRQYDDSAIAGQVAALSVITTSTKFGVVQLGLPPWPAWSAAVYPAGFGSLSTIGLSIGSPPTATVNCLDTSLAVVTFSVSGTPYNVTFQDVTTSEHAQIYKPIDVFINGALTWNSAWDKYSIIRVHNCSSSAASATFGSVTATLLPAGCQCFRKLASGEWIVCGNYFHWMADGDGRFMQMQDDGQTGLWPAFASIFYPAGVLNVFSALAGNVPSGSAGGGNGNAIVQNSGGLLSHDLLWDMSGIYNNADYTPDGLENPLPAGGYYPPLTSLASPIGDFLVPKGSLLVANRATAPANASMTQTVELIYNSNTGNADPVVWAATSAGTPVNVAISDVIVTDLTTGVVIPVQSNPSDPSTLNYSVNAGNITILPRGSEWNGTAWVPMTPSPYAPFISNADSLQIAFTFLPTAGQVFVDFDGFENLAANLAAAGVTSRAQILNKSDYAGGVAGTMSNLEIFGTSSWHLIDVSTSLLLMLTTGQFPARVIGSTQTATPPSLSLPVFLFSALACTPSIVTSTTSYNAWTVDASGNPVLGANVPVTLTNSKCTSMVAYNPFLSTDPMSSLAAWLQIQSAGSLLSIENFRLMMTPLGCLVVWDEVWSLNAQFGSLFSNNTSVMNWQGSMSRVIFNGSSASPTITATHYIRLDACRSGGTSFNLFPTPSAAGALWNYPRMCRCYRNDRFFYHDPADAPMMPDSGWQSVRFVSVPPGAGDNLDMNEFFAVKAWFENSPVSVDSILPVLGTIETSLARLGAFMPGSDNWCLFSYWLNNVGNAFSYTVSPAAGGTASLPVSYTPGWYLEYSNDWISNASGGLPCYNVLPLQVENYNFIASCVNALPPTIFAITSLLNDTMLGAVNFTLNFSAANIIIVNGGAGYTVGQGLNFNLAVARVDGNGAITAVAQNGTVVVNTYDAYATPLRPFALASAGGATCDTSSGDGSALTFIPVLTLNGVPLLPGVTGTFWPRNAYFTWNGPTAGGADPLGDYLAGRGLDVQASPPDGYAPQTLNLYGQWISGAYSEVSNAGDWLITPAFAIQAATYRSVTIDSVRTLYSTLNLPFTLNFSGTPCSFTVEHATLQSQTNTGDGIATAFALGYYPIFEATSVAKTSPVPTAPTTTQPPDAPVTLLNIPGFIVQKCGFYCNLDGAWLTNAATSIRSSYPVPLPNNQVVGNTVLLHDYFYIGTIYDETQNTLVWLDAWQPYCQVVVYYCIIRFSNLDNGLATVTAQVLILENAMNYVAACVPQNYVYADSASANGSLFFDIYGNACGYVFLPTGLGSQIIPLIADNTVENNPATCLVCSGTGGVFSENVITTTLPNALLVLVPVDSTIQSVNPPPPSGGI